MSFRGKKFKIAVAIAGLALAILLFLLSPVFHIQTVVIQGNNRVGRADIETRLGLNVTSNIFLLNTTAARRRIMGNLYVGDVAFTRQLPGHLTVTVFERRPSAYVAHMGNFLVLDDFGRVLEVRQERREMLPLLEGLQFSRWNLGEVLAVENTVDFSNVVLYTQLLVQYGLIHDISHINVSDPSNIRILVNYLEFHVGGIVDADEKVRTIIEMLNNLPDASRVRGYVNLQDITTQFNLNLLQ
ncbi:MAG: FtsQ-type POTRA domain-containing protein [Defluviitaleaceae bacterium]|nr:FtsQ-type POTRA domain-containing protein [Defluviitaleaceae bacterium]